MGNWMQIVSHIGFQGDSQNEKLQKEKESLEKVQNFV